MISTFFLLALLQEPQPVAPAPVPVEKPATVDTQAPGAVPAPEQWTLIDGVQLIVNEEAVTSAYFFRELARAGKPATTKAELDQRTQAAAVGIVERLLKTQAGKDLGFDPTLVGRYAREEFDQTVEQHGSLMQLGARLEKLDMDPQQLREDNEASIYRQLWEGAADGRSAGPGGRPHVDRYVRPGLLSLEYTRVDATDVAPTLVTLQEIDLTSEHAGGAEKALAFAKSLRERALAGEDFAKLVDDYSAGPKGLHGVTGPHDLKLLRSIPEVGEFLGAGVKSGDLSQALPLRIEGELRGYRLLKIVALEAPEPPRFDSRPTQNQLRKSIETRNQNFRRERGLRELLDAAYVWPPEAFQRARPAVQSP